MNWRRFHIIGISSGILLALTFSACWGGAADQGSIFARQPTVPGVNPQLTATQVSPVIWHPAPGVSFQWQLSGLPINQLVNAAVFDIDLFDVDASVVSALHARGRKVICYIDVGSWENWRPDARAFPSLVIGKEYGGYPDEKWLDIRQINILGPIMEARMDQCKSKGFDGVEPDNIDGYTNDTGFPLTARDQLAYNRFLADAAHARGLSIGLKNDFEQVNQLLTVFDWALSEECFFYHQCDSLIPFIQAGKAVFDVEYQLDPDEFCSQANAMMLTALKKHLSLDAYRVPCQ